VGTQPVDKQKQRDKDELAAYILYFPGIDKYLQQLYHLCFTAGGFDFFGGGFAVLVNKDIQFFLELAVT
jgi:hypothetical protein